MKEHFNQHYCISVNAKVKALEYSIFQHLMQVKELQNVYAFCDEEGLHLGAIDFPGIVTILQDFSKEFPTIEFSLDFVQLEYANLIKNGRILEHP